jgi:hypothetical protein
MAYPTRRSRALVAALCTAGAVAALAMARIWWPLGPGTGVVALTVGVLLLVAAIREWFLTVTGS